ncbi:MAG: hypothetical protein WC359_12280 [Dehalococcoidia bacterium]|jgi:hypothetical protein
MADNALKILAAGGVGALIAALLSKNASASTGSGDIFHLDEEAMATLIGLLQSAQETNEKLAVIEARLGLGGLKNPVGVIIDVIRPLAIGEGKQLVSYDIPYDMKLLVKALPTNAGNIQLGYSKTSAESPLASYPLTRNESIAIKVARASALWICTPAGPLTDGVVMIAEQD